MSAVDPGTNAFTFGLRLSLFLLAVLVILAFSLLAILAICSFFRPKAFIGRREGHKILLPRSQLQAPSTNQNSPNNFFLHLFFSALPV